MNLVLFSLLFLVVSPAISDWQSIATEHFVLRYPPGMESMARNLESDLEPTFERVNQDLGVDYSGQVTVILTPDEKTFFSLQAPGLPSWASGTAYPQQMTIYLRPLDVREIRHRTLVNILGHELSHVLLPYRLRGQRPPRWLDEGIAIHQAREFMFDRENILFSISLTGRHIPFSELEQRFPEAGDAAALAYAQSGDMVGFIMNKFGIEAFHGLLDQFADSGDMEQAVYHSLGITPEELERRWLEQVRFYYGMLSLFTGSMFLWFVISLLGILAYVKKRRTASRKREFWEIEEEIGRLSEDPPTYH